MIASLAYLVLADIPGVAFVKPTFDVSVTVNDLNRSAAFYSDVLGLKEVGSGRIGRGEVFKEFAYGPSVIRLVRYPEPSMRTSTGLREYFGLRSIGLVDANFDSLIARLKEKKVKFTSTPASGQRERREQLTDPEGNLVELVTPEPKPGQPPATPHLQITAVVADAVGGKGYYRQKLGFAEKPDAPVVRQATGVDLFCQNSDLRLLTFTGKRNRNSPKPETYAGIRTLIFSIKDADAAWKILRDLAANIQGEVEEIEGYGKRFFIADSDGTWIEFVERASR